MIHLLRRAVRSLATQDPIGTALRKPVDALLALRSRGAAVRASWDHLQPISDALALDPHAEAATRDVRAALELL